MSELPPPLLLLGDFNAHHTVWGCDQVNTRGRHLERFISQHALCVLNTGQATHFSLPSGRESVLDLSLCSPQLASLFHWAVGGDPMGSDHLPIFLAIDDVAVIGTRPQRWNFSKADMSEFRSLLESRFEDLGDGEVLTVEQFSSLILDAAHASIPRTSGKPRRPPVPWWTDECRDAIRARRRAYKRFKRNSTQANLIEFRRTRAVCRRTIRAAKRKAWRDYVGRLNRMTPLSQVFSQIRRIDGRSVSTPLPVLRLAGRDVTDPGDVANALGNGFAERCQSGKGNQQFRRRKASYERKGVDFRTSCELSYNSPFSLRELTSVIGQLRSVADGPDLIHNEMLKWLPQNALKALLDTLNAIWELGEFPVAWREAIVIPILKPGKSGSDPLHYRPISLTSCLCKVFEKMISVRFTWHLESSGILNSKQCGFRKGRSTVDHLISLDTSVRSAFKKRRHVGAIFFDVMAAYDTVWRHAILTKAYRYGIRGQMGFFFKQFLTDRTFRVRVGGAYSNVFYQEDGIPQGSVLSIGLFVLAINDVTETLPPSISSSLFVDDIAIWATSSTGPSLERQLQLGVKHLERWSSRNGLAFSPAKTVGVHFCRKRGCCPDPHVTLDGNQISFQPSAKFLGVTLDKRLTYTAHIKNLRDKCSKSLNVLKCVSRTSYGADRKTLLNLYRSLIRSKMDYACFVYDAASDSAKRCLDTVHHCAIRVATGAFRTTPTSSLLVEANEPPLAIRRRLLGQRYAYKLAQFPNHPTYDAVFSRRQNQLFLGTSKGRPFGVRVRDLALASGVRRRIIAREEPSLVPPWEMADMDLDTTLAMHVKSSVAPVEMRSLALEHIAKYSGHVAVFTDGSKTETGVGCAFVTGVASRGFSLPPLASVFTSELIAIDKALCYLETCSETHFVIFTDSLSSIQALNAYHPSDGLVRSVQQNLSRLNLGEKSVKLCWVPSHVGIGGNEAADTVAKRASRRPCTRRLPIPARDLFPHLSAHLRSMWQNQWRTHVSNKLLAIKPEVGEWHSSSRFCRREEVALCRLRTGHTLNTHRYLLCGGTKPVCQRCPEYLTVRHVLVSCPEFDDERNTFFGPRPHALTMTDLIGRDADMIRQILAFLRAIDFTVVYDPG